MSLVEAREDAGGYEILELNSDGMFSCQNAALDEAETLLTSAFSKLENDEVTDDATFADRLKAITLNNLGVVSSHKGQARKALEHLEAAYDLELRLGVFSPSTTLNLCAAHNALRHYEKATQFALQTIDLLHKLPPAELEENKVLWGAAWHNLGIAQLNTAPRGSLAENSTVFSIFRNAMRATQDLLGPRHPMTVAVHQTYRNLRGQLKDCGVYVQHRTFPPINEHEKELTLTLVGPDKFRYQQTTPSLPFLKPHQPGGGSAKKLTASQRYSRRLQRTLQGATGVYSETHPLLSPRQGGKPRSKESSRGAAVNQRPPQTARLPPRPDTDGSQRESVAARGTTPARKDHLAPRRRLSELLMGDMWVEVNGSSTQAFLHSLQRPPPRGADNGAYYPPVRPNYAEAAHVMQPEDLDSPTHERVVDPQSNATLDRQPDPASSSDAPDTVKNAGRPNSGSVLEGLGALHKAVANADDSSAYASVRQLTEPLAAAGKI